MKRDFSLLANRQFDLLVCGGGIYGAWTAYDAALRGLSVAIVEQGDWASATSSASSKLIHGGLRYLETFDFKLVKKALTERQRLLKMAPHRVWPLRFGVPIYKDSRIGTLQLKAGLTAYDFLAGDSSSGDSGSGISHRHFNRDAFAQRFPALNSECLKGGYTYSDAQTDDARLVLELISGAMSSGAVCVNYCKLTALQEAKGNIYGAMVQDQSTSINNAESLIRAKQIVNTTGTWMTLSQQGREWCRLTKGVHLVMPPVLNDEALLLTAKSDGRVFFMIPWYGMTLLGTTDTDYTGDIEHVTVESTDVAYLLAAANDYLNTAWSEKDVIGQYAGVRVMKQSGNASPSSVSRDWELKSFKNGVHYSIGGKLTSAREDAACIVNEVCARLDKDIPCATTSRMFPWAPQGSPQQNYSEWAAAAEAQARQLNIDHESAKWLIRRHGKRVGEVLRSVAADPHLAERVIISLPFIYADFLFCARNEMAVHLDDLLRRRMPLLILAQLEAGTLHRLAELIANLMGWDEIEIASEVAACRIASRVHLL